MRIAFAALSARRPLSVACATAFAIQTAWGEQRAPDFLITSDSAIPLTSANTLQTVTVNAASSAFAPDAPAVGETINRSKIDARNIFNTEDALKYAPNLMVRKRFIGDRNSVFAGRDFNELQSARGLVEETWLSKTQ
jgi:iron complex outermembrane receptor protein